MPIYIYNTLSRKKEEFKPLNPPEVKMYTCGVTVYDDCHIGHARSLYIFYVIKRYLEYRKFKVKFVRNITDIDDKIINKARQSGIAWQEIADRFIDSYRQDIKLLGIDTADKEPKATESIEDMIKHISGLLDKGYAYVANSGVYFSVRKFKDYGKLSGQGIDQMLSGVRIEADEGKQDPLDFALWKTSKPDEPYWPSPWGMGRPGWHIECSAMSMKYLNTSTLDIHAGGRDLIFPHHENEIAQAEALTGKAFARYWIHHGLLTVNGQKMAKSQGNFVTIKDFIRRYRDADILKLFFLTTHYSNPADYSGEKIAEAKKQKKSFDDFFDKVNSWQNVKKSEPSVEDKAKIDGICAKFEQAMDDDFNTPAALASLFELIDLASFFISSDKEDVFKYAKSRLELFFNIFGLKVKAIEIPEEEKKMLEKRNQARKNKEFDTADAIREEIKKKFKHIVSDTNGSVTLTQAE
ncbi:MAG: cysteine--tRNA ligase [Candidatus Omnitrophota bacterium]